MKGIPPRAPEENSCNKVRAYIYNDLLDRIRLVIKTCTIDTFFLFSGGQNWGLNSGPTT
jgi:hypothetical protein